VGLKKREPKSEEKLSSELVMEYHAAEDASTHLVRVYGDVLE
jgi:hypothetical protein